MAWLLRCRRAPVRQAEDLRLTGQAQEGDEFWGRIERLVVEAVRDQVRPGEIAGGPASHGAGRGAA